MNRFLTLFAATLFLVSGLNSANAQELMSPTIADQLGLEQAWMRQISVPAGSQSIVDQQIFVHMENQREYVEIVRQGGISTPKTDKMAASPNSGHVLVRIPTDRVGRTGTEIGKEEAERLARNEIRRLDYRGIKGSITSRIVPRIRLYTLSDDGSIECRDAESGESVWLARVGDKRLGYGKVGVDDDYVSIVNGANLIKLDATNGTEISASRTSNTPLFGAVIAGRYTLIPTIRNGVEGYPTYETDDPPFQEMVAGLALAPPAKSPTSTKVAWGTNRGFVYVMELSGKPSVMFRLDTDGIVSGGLAAAKGDKFYFGSEVGQVYGVRATRSGKVLWSRPYGEPFYDTPILLDDKVFLRSAYGNLFSINTANGIMNWTYPVPSIGKLMGAFDGKVFARLLSGGFTVIDVESGKTIGSFYGFKPDRLLFNEKSDRLYLVGKTGAVQCLRPKGATLPTFNDIVMSTPVMEKDAATEEAVGSAPAFGDQEATMMKEKNPFGEAGGDPFGAGEADPFGAAEADPFGGGGDAMEADPFGGGDKKKEGDPFADPFN